MVISIRDMECVRCREVVRFSEGPLSEVRLYAHVTATRTHVGFQVLSFFFCFFFFGGTLAAKK